MKVLKFGGTSVANAQNILKTIAIIKNAATESRVIAVVSALSGVTDGLIKAATLASNSDENYQQTLKELEEKHLTAVQELLPISEQSAWLSFVKKQFNDLEDLCNGIFVLSELTHRTQAKIISYGEFLSSNIITAKLLSDKSDVVWTDSRKIIKTNQEYLNAKVDFEQTSQLLQEFVQENPYAILLAPGFIASADNGQTTTLGRGGSDYTASIFAAAIQADQLQIWTDVSGMMTSDPRWVSNAKVISNITYQEAMELTHFGAKVIYPPTIQPVMQRNIDLWIKNTFAPEDLGTLISNQKREQKEEEVAVGISSLGKIALLTLEGSGMIGIPGFSAKLFQCLSQAQVNVILITQSSSEHSITFAINQDDIHTAEKAILLGFEDEIKLKKVEPVTVESGLSIIALVGENMKSRPGIGSRMFGALGSNGINIRAVAQGSSEKNISAVILESDLKKAVNVLHEEFFESEIKQVHLYLCGIGNVGSRLIQQIYDQNEYLKDQLHLNLKIVGISNSKKMIFDEDGLSQETFIEKLQEGENSSPQKFANELINRNLRNSIFVDITANEQVISVYEPLLQKSISVIACNKIAASSALENYKKLKTTATNHNGKFLFETNVGAALPVIGTINDLKHSGDKIVGIKAVLSGTLNFVFNNYDGSRSFSEVVRQAQAEGYTEPDPRLDLAGTDVARKILILAREAGYPLEFDEVKINGFLPQECFNGDVEDFYRAMSRNEDHFKQMYDEAKSEGKILKFVAEFSNGKAEVGLQKIDSESDLYRLYGKDNVVMFNTLRYVDQPLVIKGAGAGAEVTASGVFADIVRSV